MTLEPHDLPLTAHGILTRIDEIRDRIAGDWAKVKSGRTRCRTTERRLRVALVDITFWAKSFRTLTRLPPAERPAAAEGIVTSWRARQQSKAQKSSSNRG